MRINHPKFLELFSTQLSLNASYIHYVTTSLPTPPSAVTTLPRQNPNSYSSWSITAPMMMLSNQDELPLSPK